MGAVYAAYDPKIDRKTALKVLRPDAAEGRLLREAKGRDYDRATPAHARAVSDIETWFSAHGTPLEEPVEAPGRTPTN
jgi:hypothetical protein